MFHQLVVALCVVALCAIGDGRHAISEQKIQRNYKQMEHREHDEQSNVEHKAPEHHEKYADAYPSYEFTYKVSDPHTKDYKGQHEVRDGDEVKGEYWLREPKGRMRTVKYHADKHSGFKADVEYSAPHIHVYHNMHQKSHGQDDIKDNGAHEQREIPNRRDDPTEEDREENKD